MPTLNWIGKEAVINHHLDVPFHLLKDVPDLACGDSGSGNLIVEGDNLLALKALLPYYKGKVKCICIDPPYNTGNEGWAYNDNVNSPAIKKWLGETVGKEGETLDRHDRWLCMMYPRLALLREFLSKDGSIWVSLDDNELHALRYVLDEVFGGQNFVCNFVWQSKDTPGNNATGVAETHNHIVVYRRTEVFVANMLDRDEKQLATYKNPDDDERGPWLGTPLTRGEHRERDYYALTNPVGKEVLPPAGTCWRRPPDVMKSLAADNRIWWGKKGDAQFPMEKKFLSEVKAGVVNRTWWPYEFAGSTRNAGAEIKELFGKERVFDTPKPTRLIERILQIATNPGDLVLDSFAGSGTTGHAVLKMNTAQEGSADTPARNKSNGGQAATNEEADKSVRAPLRRFILVEMDEKIAPEITRERVKRVAEGYKNAKGEKVPGLGGGFRYVRLGETLFDEHGRINETKVRFADLARHVYFTETGEPLPKERVSAKTPLLGIHHGRAVYLLYNGILKDKSIDGGNALTNETLAHLPAHDGPKVVYAARCPFSKARLEREGIIFKQTPYAIRTR
jgi:adenine-specific DNA-methyltransferase